MVRKWPIMDRVMSKLEKKMEKPAMLWVQPLGLLHICQGLEIRKTEEWMIAQLPHIPPFLQGQLIDLYFVASPWNS